MADNVWPQGPDGLFDLQKVLARDNVSDYVENGVGFTPTWSADETDISAGTAVIRDGDLAFIVEPDSRTDVPLPSSTGVNYVYLAFDPDTDNAISYHVDTDDSPPADPSLKVAELDAGAQTVTEVNRDPAVTFEGAALTSDLDAGGHDLNNVGSTTTDQITNVFDHVTTTPEDTIENDLAAGESVAIGPGTYSISLDANEEGINVTKSNVTIWLHPGATVKLADGQTTSTSDGGLFVVADGVSGVTFEGQGTIDGNQANNTTVTNTANFGLIRAGQNVTDLRVTCEASQSPGTGVLVRGTSGNESKRIWVRDCSLVNNGEGVLWRYADDVHVIDNVIDGTHEQDGIEPVHSEKWEIRGNVIRDTAGSAVDMFDQTIEGVVADNRCENNTNSAIALGGNNNEDIEIVNNHVTGCGQKGIVVSNATDCAIRGNRVEGSANQGIDIPSGNVGVDVTNNTCRNNGTQGIRHVGDNCVIQGNRCLNNGQSDAGMRGIRASGDRQTITGNYLYDTQATATQQYGIQADGTSQVVIANHGHGNSAGQILDQTDSASSVALNKDGADLEVDLDPANAYSPSNDATDRTFDTNNTTTAELADVVATLIRDLGLDT